MAKVKLIATKPHSFGMRVIEVDEEFEADNEQQAQTLVSLGRARLVEAKSTAAKATTTKPAEAPTKTEAEGEAYKTRRLKADDK